VKSSLAFNDDDDPGFTGNVDPDVYIDEDDDDIDFIFLDK